MKKILIISLVGLFLVSFISGQIQVGTSGDVGVDLNIPTATNYTIVSVNNSIYWDSHPFSFLGDTYVPYTGANQNVDLGANNLTVFDTNINNNLDVSGKVNIDGNIPAGYGLEIISNGVFDDSTSWIPSGGWTISGGEAHFSDSALSIMVQTLSTPIVAGTTYLLEFDISDATGTPYFGIRLNNNILVPALGLNPIPLSNGHHTYEFVASNGGTSFVPRADVSSPYSLDNITIKEKLSQDTSPVFMIKDNVFNVLYGGNVGIGTTTPGAMLDVYGLAATNPKLTIRSNLNFINLFPGSALSVFQFSEAKNFGITAAPIITSGGTNQYSMITFGATRDTAFGDMVYNPTDNGYRVDIQTAGSNGGLRVATGDSIFLGDVGIGTASPQNKLNVIGDGNFTGNLTANWFKGLFNWITGDTWNIFNGSTLTFNASKLSTIYYNATQSAFVTGTLNAGTLANTQHSDGIYDGVTMNFSEEAGSPALDVRINFTNIESFNRGVIRYKTSNLAGAYPIIQMWNYDMGVWEDYPPIAESLTFATITQPVFDASDHVQDNVAQMRIYKASNGNTNNHYYVDWIAVSKGYGTPSGEEIDPYSFHRFENLNNTGYNITASNFFGGNITLTNGGKVWDNSTCTFISSPDGSVVQEICNA